MIDVSTLLDTLRETYGVKVATEHTGGGNFVALVGDTYDIDDETGVTRADLTIGPIYRETDGRFSANRADLYFVSLSDQRADETIHVAAQLLPTALSFLGIEDVNVSDAGMDLDEISAALGDEWSVGCLGGNIYGVVRLADGATITLDEGHRASFLPAHVVIGRQSETDDEWTELYSGPVYEPADVVALVADRA